MLRRLLTIGLLTFPIGELAAGQCQHLVAIGVGERAPYQWQTPDQPGPQGASVTLLTRVAEQLGLTLDILTADSLEQAEQEVVSGRVDLLIDATLRPELLEELDFLHPPLYEIPVVAWVAKERAFAFRGGEDLQGRKGVSVGEASPVEDQLRLIAIGDFSQAIMRMLAGEVDYVLFEQWTGQLEVLRQEWEDQVEVLLPPVYKWPRYLALSQNSACNFPELRGGLTKSLHRSTSEGAAESSIREAISGGSVQK